MIDGKEKIILVVEDDPVLREMSQRQLKALGYDSVVVANAEDAVEHCLNMEIALIFMDIGLPGLDGARATMLIREHELRSRRKRVPIIALTAHSDRERCLFAGMDDFLQKPVLLKDMRVILDKWLSNHDGK